MQDDGGKTPEVEVSWPEYQTTPPYLEVPVEIIEPQPFGAPDPTFDVTRIRCGECGAEVLHDERACKPTAIRVMEAAARYLLAIDLVEADGTRRHMSRGEAADHAQAIVRAAGIILD